MDYREQPNPPKLRWATVGETPVGCVTSDGRFLMWWSEHPVQKEWSVAQHHSLNPIFVRPVVIADPIDLIEDELWRKLPTLSNKDMDALMGCIKTEANELAQPDAQLVPVLIGAEALAEKCVQRLLQTTSVIIGGRDETVATIATVLREAGI